MFFSRCPVLPTGLHIDAAAPFFEHAVDIRTVLATTLFAPNVDWDLDDSSPP